MKKKVFILLSVVTLLGYCKKADVTPPVINSLNFETNDTLSNKFTLKVDATDNKSISKIQYFSNDSLIAEADKAPFDFEWNTLQVKDGNYTVKVVVYDSEGNKTASSRNVVIQNVLLSLKMGSLYPIPYNIVVSDEKGNILNSTTFSSNENKKIMPLLPFEDKAINLVYYYKPFNYTYIYGYVHVKRGSEFKLGFREPGPTDKRIKLHLKNDIGLFTQIIISTDRTWITLNSMSDTTTYLTEAIPYTLNHELLIQINTGTEWLYKFFTIENIESLSINLSSLNNLQTVKQISLPAPGNLSYSMYGRVDNEDGFYDCFINLGFSGSNNDHVKLFYPQEYFSQYITSITFNANYYITYQNIYVGEIPSAFSKMDASAEIINPSPGNFKANLSGVFDYYEAHYVNTKCNLSVFSPSGIKGWMLPDISKVFDISDLNFSELVLLNVKLREFESINWANKYFDLNEVIQQLIYTDKYQQNVLIQVNPEKLSSGKILKKLTTKLGMGI